MKRKPRWFYFRKEERQKERDKGLLAFLVFTFYWGKSRSGRFVPKLKTIRKRLRSKLVKVSKWIKQTRNQMKLYSLWKRFRSKLIGHCQYYGVSHNYKEVVLFFREAIRIFFKWINRRSQRLSFNWDKFGIFLKKHPPPRPRIIHKLF